MEIILPAGLLLVLGILSPMVIQLITKASMSANTKRIVAIALTVALAAFWGITSGGIVLVTGAGAWALFQSLVVGGGVIYGLQQAIYKYMFKGTALAESLANKGISDKETDANGDGFVAEEFDTDTPVEDDVISEEDLTGSELGN